MDLIITSIWQRRNNQLDFSLTLLCCGEKTIIMMMKTPVLNNFARIIVSIVIRCEDEDVIVLDYLNPASALLHNTLGQCETFLHRRHTGGQPLRRIMSWKRSSPKRILGYNVFLLGSLEMFVDFLLFSLSQQTLYQLIL